MPIKNCRGNDNEKTHENLVALPCHHVLSLLLALVTSDGLA